MAHHKVNKMVALQAMRAYQQKKKDESDNNIFQIFTDASYVNQSFIGAVSYIVTSNNKEIKRFSEPYIQKTDILFLETLAISKAVVATMKKHPTAKIEVYTDSIPAITLLKQMQNSNKKPKRFDIQKLELNTLLKNNVSYMHIKAHQCPGKSVFGDFNREADALARRASKRAISRT